MRINCKMHVKIDRGIDAGESIIKDTCMIQRANDESCGIVRMYCLDRPSLILTADQRESEVDMAKLEADGIPVHRHIRTGGGALFIGPQDFTISVAIGKGVFPVPIRGLRVYCMFSSILMNALGHLGVLTDKSNETRTGDVHSATCFGTLDKGELINMDGGKIYGGSHVRRTHNGYFHYGFVPLSEQNNQVGRYLKNHGGNVIVPSSLKDAKITFDDLADMFTAMMYGEHPEWRP